MPANGRWGLIRRLKVNDRKVGEKEEGELFYLNIPSLIL